MKINFPSYKGDLKAFCNKILFYLLLSVTFLVPIFFLPAVFISTQFGTSLLFAYGVIASILIYIISASIRGSVDLPRPGKYAVGFLLVVPAVYVLAGIANGFSRISFFGYTFDISKVGFILLSFCYFFFVSILFKNKYHIFYSYFAFVVSSLLFSLFLLIRIIFGPKILAFGLFNSLTSTMVGSWNNVGIFFGIAVILSFLTFEMVNLSRFMKVLISIAMTLSLFFIALVNFSIVSVVVAVCAFLFILYSLFISIASLRDLSLKEKLFKIPRYPLIVLFISLLFIFWGSTLGNYLGNRLGTSNVEVRPSFAVTLNIAKSTIASRPLFGSGPNTFVTQWLTFKPDNIVSTAFWNTDFANGIGLIPTFAVTTGILGIASWFIFLGFYLYLGFKSIFVKIEDRIVKYLLVSSFFVSLYLWIMTFVYVPSAVIFILTFFFTGLFFSSVYLADIIEVKTYNFSLNPRAGFISSLVMLVLFIGSLVLGYGLYKNSKSLWYFQKSFYALNTTGNISMSEDYMLKAIAAVPNDVYFRALSEIEIIKLNALLSQDPTSVKKEDLQNQFSETLANAIKAGLAAKDRDPSNYLNWVSLGRVYAAVSIPELKVDGAYESAQAAYSEAFRRNPKNPGILVLEARLALDLGDLKRARYYALQAITIKRDYLDAYFLLSQIEVQDNNIQGAIDSVTAASIIDPTNPAIFFQLGLLKYNNKDFTGAITSLEKATSMTPDYANAKYFLGLSYEEVGEHEKAIKEFEEIKITNPDNTEVQAIIANLKAGRTPFENASSTKPEKGKTLPVREKIE